MAVNLIRVYSVIWRDFQVKAGSSQINNQSFKPSPRPSPSPLPGPGRDPDRDPLLRPGLGPLSPGPTILGQS